MIDTEIQEPPSIEDQLWHYAEAIDPSGMQVEPAADLASRRRIRPMLGWRVVTAAAALALVAGAFVVQTNRGAPTDAAAPSQAEMALALPSPERDLQASLAWFVLTDECMTAKGHRGLVMPLPEELVMLHGGWKPHGLLGVRSEGAARVLGYQNHGWDGQGSGSQAAAWSLVPLTETEDTFAELRSCQAQADQELGIERKMKTGADSSQEEALRADVALDAALAQWQDCVNDAVGIEADTPNTLARQFAFGSSETPAREVEVAVVDAACQRAAEVQEAFHRAERTHLLTELRGEERDAYLAEVRSGIATDLLAQQVLDERDIVAPSLD